MTIPKNITPNAKGAFLSVDEHGQLICVTYLCSWGGERLHTNMPVNTFDFPQKAVNCNNEYYINNKVMPGYECE